jgi:general stress protein 26
MDQKIMEKAVEIISEKKLDCVLSLIDLDGYPTGSAIRVVKNDRINWLTFATYFDSNKVKRIDKCNLASVCFFSFEPYYNITLVGKIEVLTDTEIKKEMWHEGCEEVFSGYEDENYCVLKFVTERYKIFFGENEVEGKI